MKSHDEICEAIFKSAGKIRAEILAESSEISLTRFSGNVISQNVFSASTGVSVRLLDGGKTVNINLNQTSPAQIKKRVKEALPLLKSLKKTSREPGPLKNDGKDRNAEIYFKETAGLSPAFRAEKIKALARKCRKRGQVCHGTLENGWRKTTVANSEGLKKSFRESFAVFEATAEEKGSFGWAQGFSRDAREINFEEIGESASRKARLSKNPVSLPPGEYEVVLEPSAAAELLSFVIFYGFNSRAYAEGRSFASGNLNKKILGSNISLCDDAHEGPARGMPFDWEGAHRKKMTLVENGIVREIPMDRKTAKELKMKSTGHSLPRPNPFGAVPMNARMPAGNKSIDEMIKGVGRGILITQFHYVNLLRPLPLETTGMTRNGTFLVENGKIKRPVKNMRFTESLVKAFNNVSEISRETDRFYSWGGIISAPALKIKKFGSWH